VAAPRNRKRAAIKEANCSCAAQQRGYQRGQPLLPRSRRGGGGGNILELQARAPAVADSFAWNTCSAGASAATLFPTARSTSTRF